MSHRHQRIEANLGRFIDQYGRPKRPGRGEPNDRKYDRAFERLVKRMDPRELDLLLRGGGEETVQSQANATQFLPPAGR